MPITNAYATLPSLKQALSMQLTDATDDDALGMALEAASRQIDAHCGGGRRFWQDSAVVDRFYWPTSAKALCVDDISTTTGLVVKLDTGDDGAYATTLTINTDFILTPSNAAAEFPVRPWTAIMLLDTYSYSRQIRPSVKVTAKFGWSAIPDAVERACVFQAKNIFKAPDLFWGSFQLAQEGSPQKVPSMDPLARALLEPFIRYDEVD